MKASDLRDLNLHELEEKEKELTEELFKLKIRHSLNQLDNPIEIRHKRRHLARVKTLVSDTRSKQA